MIIYDEMVREKMNKLRIGLMAIGCSNFAFWLSWWITGMIFSAVMTVLMYITGFLFSIPFFVGSPFYVIFLHFYSVCICYVSIAIALVTVMTTREMAYTVSYAIILMNVIIVAGLCDVIYLYKMFYNLDMPPITLYFRYVFYFCPNFHFSKLYGDIVRVTCYHINPELMLWAEGRPYEFEDLFRERSGRLATQDRYEAPSMFHSLQIIWSVSFLYLLVAWYFDNVMTSNRGFS
jgi:ABC-2 family transporter protein